MASPRAIIKPPSGFRISLDGDLSPMASPRASVACHFQPPDTYYAARPGSRHACCDCSTVHHTSPPVTARQLCAIDRPCVAPLRQACVPSHSLFVHQYSRDDRPSYKPKQPVASHRQGDAPIPWHLPGFEKVLDENLLTAVSESSPPLKNSQSSFFDQV